MPSFLRLAPLFAATAIAASGCGGDSDSGAGPLDNALGYLPEDAPLVITIDTDVEGSQFKNVQKIADKFPFADQLSGQLKQRLESGDVSYENDVKPLLGNEFVVGATDVNSIVNRGSSGGLDGGEDSDDDEFVGAVQVKDSGKLEDLIKNEGEEKGEESGAKIYEDDDGDAFAIEDDVLVVADSRNRLEQALEQRDADDRLTEEEFDKTVDGLPKEALVKVGGDLQRLIATDPDTKQAQEVKWVAALRTFGAALSFTGDSAEVSFKLGTDGGDLSDEDIPLATGAESPGVLDLPNEIGIGLRDPAQLFTFGESAAQAVDPEQYADYQQTKAAAERRLGIDIDDDLIGQLEGDASISVSTRGDVGVRIELADEAKFSDTLDKLEKELPAFISSTGGSRTRLTRAGDVTVIRSADGDTLAYKVEDGALVLSNRPSRVEQVAGEQPVDVPGAKGALVMSADAEELVLQALRSQGGSLGGGGLGGGLGQALGGRIIAGSLDQLTGSAEASKDGITGKFSLSFD
jgi:hypothetical protein